MHGVMLIVRSIPVPGSRRGHGRLAQGPPPQNWPRPPQAQRSPKVNLPTTLPQSNLLSRDFWV